MDVKEKLVELCEGLETLPCCDTYEGQADYLIAHGVTVQEWIPFDDVKPKDGQSVLGVTTEGEMDVYQFDANWQTCLCRFAGLVRVFNITHWQPIPQPPKGE